MKKRYQLVFIILALLLFYFVLNKVGFQKIAESIKMLKWYYLLTAILMNLTLFMVLAYKWKLLVDKITRTAFLEIFQLQMASTFLNTSTPTGSMGGEPLRIHYISKKIKKEGSKLIMTAVIDRMTNTAAALFFIILSTLFVSLFLEVSNITKVIVQSLLVVALLLTAVVIFYRKINKEKILKIIHPLFKKKFREFKQFKKYFKEQKEKMKLAMREFYKNKKEFRQQMALGILVQLMLFAKAYLIFIALEHFVNPFYVIISVSISLAISQLMLVPGGIGIMESSMISMYSLLGINPGLAAIVAIIDRVIYYFFALGMGYVMFTYVNYKYSKK